MEHGISFSRHDDRSAATIVFKDKKRFDLKVIGQYPLDKEWQRKEYVRDIIERGIDRLCFIPIFDSDDKPYCMFSLYLMPSDNIDVVKIKDFSKLFTSLVEQIVSSSSDIENEFRRNMHEIKTSVSIIKNQMSSLSLLKNNIEFNSKKEKRLANKRFFDVYRSFNLIEKSLTIRDSRRRIEKRKISAKFIEYYENVNSISRSIINRYKRSEVQLDHFSLPENIEIRVDTTDFRMLMQNIVENAAKHSRIHSSIRIQSEVNTYGLVLTISNLGEISPDTVLEELWEDGVRGRLAEERAVPGQGMGMGIIRNVCTVYGIRYTFNLTPVDDVTKTNERWFRMSLTFPRRMWREK